MPDRAESLKKLDLVRFLAVIDLAMLVVLVTFSVSGNRGGVAILGPIHGILVLGLLYVTGVGAYEKRWPWLFPVTTLLPIFALIYDPKLRREIEATGSAA
ncbi:MAG: hypothetical protein H0V81_06190 [Solirubrobacterales bacterium]|nr:hypothetical protein [Solirubrobacterales bacterium]